MPQRSSPPTDTTQRLSGLKRTFMTWLQWPRYVRQGASSMTQGYANKRTRPSSPEVTTYSPSPASGSDSRNWPLWLLHSAAAKACRSTCQSPMSMSALAHALNLIGVLLACWFRSPPAGASLFYVHASPDLPVQTRPSPAERVDVGAVAVVSPYAHDREAQHARPLRPRRVPLVLPHLHSPRHTATGRHDRQGHMTAVACMEPSPHATDSVLGSAGHTNNIWLCRHT